MNSFDHTTTAHDYAVNRQPTQAAYRGVYELPHMSQQNGRDFAGEEYSKKAGPYSVIQTSVQWREQVNCPYLYVIKCPLFMSHTAFRTAEDLLDWCRAYAVTLRPKGGALIEQFSAEIGDLADWLPLELRDLSQ